MESLDSPPQTNLQILENSNNDIFDSKEKDDIYNDETGTYKEHEGDEDDKIVDQNNTNLELQKQKLIFYNNLDKEDINEELPVCRIDSTNNIHKVPDEQENQTNPKNDDSNDENERNENTDKSEMINNFYKEVSETENYAEHDTQNETSKLHNEEEYPDSSFHTTFSETSVETSDSDNLKHFQTNNSEKIDLKPSGDFFPAKPFPVTPEEPTNRNNDYEDYTYTHGPITGNDHEETNDAELQIWSPKVNGNHKEANDSTCDSPEQKDNTIQIYTEIENTEKSSTKEILSEADIQQNVIFHADKTTEKHKIELFTAQSEETAPSVSIINTESRCSTPDSVCSSSTVHSSSSQQLVIDHPTEEEKITPLRLTLKKHGKIRTQKQSRSSKNKVTMNTAAVSKSPNSKIFESSEKQETPNVDSKLVPKMETGAESSFKSSSLFDETKNATVEQFDAVMLPHNTLVLHTEDSTSKSKTYLSCDCNRTISESGNVLSSHLHTCPSYKSTATNYYKCISCGTYHENWSFFLHLREQHNRFLCLYCIKCFPTAEKLSLHLEIKHDLEQNHFNSEESLRSSAAVLNGYALETRFLMCCTCQHVFCERVAFTEHICMEYMKSCVFCGQKGRHTNQCKAHPYVKRRNKKKVKEKQSGQSVPTPNEVPLTNTQEEPSPESQTVSMKPTTHNEDSNSSSNMVIDESCTTNHTLSGKINTFDEPEEPVFPEQSFDTREESSLHPLVEEPKNTNINFLKFKLRVPKEFQKPVDAVISSSDSDDGAYEEENADEGYQKNESELFSFAKENENINHEEFIAEQTRNTESNQSVTSPQEVILSKNEVGDESLDEEVVNPHLARLLQEIEQTKLDIKRTKETIHHAHAQKMDSAPLNAEEEKNERKDIACPLPVEESPERNWTPTPPDSPKLTENTNDNEPLTHDTAMELENNADGNVETPIVITETDNSFNILPTDRTNVGVNYTENVANEGKVDKIEPNKPNSLQNITNQEEEVNIMSLEESKSETEPAPPSDGIDLANEDSLTIDLQIDRPIGKYESVEFVRTCLKAAYPYCLYCNHARRIAVNGESLVLHLLAQHRFSATVDSITAEELRPETIVGVLKCYLPELRNEFFNTNSYCTIGAGAFTRHFNERIFECFQCRFVTTTHKELYLHNRKMHLRTAILCFMCRCNFFSFSEILCHICPGIPHKVSIFEIKFRCCLCDLDNIPSPFRLMVHLRKRHFACDICLEDCRDQSKLSSHVWKHKLHHLCYRCGIAYRNKMDITKHLFWKHGTESAICKRCLNKRWPHVYHFCVPPSSFVCEVCQHCFTKAMYLTVHKRIHLGDFRYPCTEENCEEKFISRKLLLKHAISHQTLEVENSEKDDFKENTNINEAVTVASDLKQDLKGESEDKNICEVDKKEIENSEDQVDQKLIQESDSGQQSQDQPVQEQKPEELNINNESVKPPQKKKKKKRAKELLEDLNLTAPNLSESGSSSDSESETKSKYEEEESKVQLSPKSENGDVKELKLSEMEEVENPENVLDIWKNFLQAQQASGTEVDPSQLDVDLEDNVDTPPKFLHVCYSDHDYCKMFNPSKTSESSQKKNRSKSKSVSERKRTQSMQKTGNRNSNASSSSSDESSDTTSSSSCSCGSNCSCSGGSSSSSSSSSSENSDSSAVSRKRQRKKSERSRRKKSESISPRKSHSVSEILNVTETDENTPLQGIQETENSVNIEKSEPLSESFINESDLETAESETDEEYYDEHPQKLASELLSQKRAQLMARTFLSPSHNFDIVENSRPSTPSLPEDVVYEKRKKKKKRDRKSTSKSNILPPTFKVNHTSGNDSNLAANITAHEVIQSQYLALGNNSAETTTPPFQQVSANFMELTAAQQPNFSQHGTPRISEGSSCSDVDGSLKRSKRARRPNKFYGYTSDDESMGSTGLGQSLLIGTRTFKPQPPPPLVWHKEDLPTPSKSIFNNRKTPRAQKRHETDSYSGLSAPDDDMPYGSLPKKKKMGSSSLQSFSRKRSNKLPPIPRLKIRPALFGISNSPKLYKNEHLHNSLHDSTQFDDGSGKVGSHDGDDSSDASSEDGQNQAWNNLPPTNTTEHQQVPRATHQALKQSLASIAAPLPPTPQTTVFNHKIPPALLPNPDFATLQYFKANNIRYPIRPPAGARAARDGESVYCYCRCPYDEVSEMIACDGDNCLIEWFHFECVGIMVAPQGKWFCAECRPHYSEDLYPQTVTPNLMGNFREH